MAITKALISEYMNRDLSRLFPIALVLVMVMLYIMLRSVWGIIAPVLVTIFSILWTFGLKALVHSPLTIAETSIPVMLIAIGCADGVHIASEFFYQLKKGSSVREAITDSMHILALPIIMTSVTTSLGFSSLLTAPGISIRNMGIFLSFGVIVAMLFSLLFIPAFLSFYKNKKHIYSSDKNRNREIRFNLIMEKTGSLILKHRAIVFITILIFLIVSVLGIVNVKVESDEVKYFKKDNPFRIATESIEKNLGGIVSLDIVVEGSDADTIKQPGILHAIRDLQDYCQKQELVSYSISIADYIERINYILHDNDKEYERIPEEVETVDFETEEEVNGKTVIVKKQDKVRGVDQVAQFLLLYEFSGGESLDKLVDTDYQTARINVRLKDTSNRKLAELIDILKPYIEKRFPKDIKVKFTNHYVRVIMAQLIIKSQITSLFLIFAAVLILLSVIFRSPAVGIIMVAPVSIAVLFNFMIMWILNITLNIGTSIIASVGMGVGIDYAIHYFSRFRIMLKEAESYEKAIQKALVETSRAILSNAAAVGIGFIVLTASEYHVIASLGWITALSMFTTAVSSLTMLPVLLAIFKPKIPKSSYF